MITRKNFLIGAAATAATASAIDCESIDGNRLVTGRARGLVGGAFMGVILAIQTKGEEMNTIIATASTELWPDFSAATFGVQLKPNSCYFIKSWSAASLLQNYRAAMFLTGNDSAISGYVARNVHGALTPRTANSTMSWCVNPGDEFYEIAMP